MARDHARMYFSLWSGDFTDLLADEQRMYTLVFSQSTLTHAGVAPLTIRRWAMMAADTVEDDVRAALKGLEAARYVVIDEDTEEVFVRSFLRSDHVMQNPNVAIAAVRGYEQIASPRLREAWMVELRRLHAESLIVAEPDKAWTDPRSSKVLAQVLGIPSGTPFTAPAEGGSEPLPERGTQPPSEGGSTEPLTEPLTEGGLPTRTRTRRARVSRAAPAPAPSPATSPATSPPPGGTAAPRAAMSGKPPTSTPNPDPASQEFATAAGPAMVVTAYVDGATGTGRPRPARSLCARVGAQATELLAEGHPLSAVTAAARDMGAGGWTDLAVQLQRTAVPGPAPSGGRRPFLNPADTSRYNDPI